MNRNGSSINRKVSGAPVSITLNYNKYAARVADMLQEEGIDFDDCFQLKDSVKNIIRDGRKGKGMKSFTSIASLMEDLNE